MYNPQAFQATPQTYNSDPLGALLRGYQVSQLPSQMKQEQQMNAMKQAQLQQQMKSQPQIDAEKLKALQMQNQYYPQQQQSEIALRNAQANKEGQKQAQQEALAKYLSSGSDNQSDQSTQPSSLPTGQTTSLGQMPPINTSTKYGQTTPNPMLMDGGQAPGQQPVQATAPQLLEQQGPMQALQQGMQKPVAQAAPTQPVVSQQNAPVDYSNIDTLPSSGNSKMDALDKAWLQNPAAVEGQFGLYGSKKTIPNLANGQMIEQTTLPSGRTMYKPIQVTQPSSGTTIFDQVTGKPLVQLGGGGAASNINSKQGEGVFYKTDEEGNVVLDKNTGKPIPLGTLTPYTEKERDEMAGRALMNDLQPIVNNAQSNYAGKGSITKFASDVKYVEEHPDEDSEQKRRLVDFKLSEKLLAPLTVKEQQTLGASNTLGGFRAIQPSLKNSDLPSFMKVYESFKVPGSVSKEAGEKFLKLITESTTKANAQIPAFQKRYYNIEDQQVDQARALAKASKDNTSSSASTGEETISIIDPNGIARDIPISLKEQALKAGGKLNG